MSEPANVIRLEPELQRHVRSRLTRLPKPVAAAHAHAKLRLLQRLLKFFSCADDSLFQHADTAANNATQNAFFDAMRELRVQRKAVERRFLEALDEAFAQTVEADPRDNLRADGQLAADALSLVQNDELQQLVALEATVARVERELQNWLQPVTAALDACCQAAVTNSNNPLGPQVLCSAMMAQIKRLDMDTQAKLVLFAEFDRIVLAMLPRILAELAERLPAPKAAAPEGAADPGQEQAHSALLQWLNRAQKLALQAAPGANLDFEHLLGNQQFHAHQPLSLSYTERETLRMVQMLFGFVLHDPALAQAIKQQLCRLQIPVAKLALLDQNFFTQPQHPARRLLNAMTSAAIGWQPVARPRTAEDTVYRQICVTVEQVLLQYQENDAVFTPILAGFEQFVEGEKRRASLVEQRIVSAEDGKARMQQVRARAAEAIDGLLSTQAVPPCARQLLAGPWSKVLFVTGLQAGVDSAAWAQQLQTAKALIWSVQLPGSAERRQQLIKRLPNLMQALRQGLDLTSYDPFAIEKLLTQLEAVHLARIRGEALAAEASPAPAEDTQSAQATAAKARDEADAVYLQAVENFARGAWFDLQDEEAAQPLRCRLAAFIKPTGMYIFVNRSGAKVAERSQAQLAQSLKNGQLKPLDQTMLFDRALESIVGNMRKSKPTMPLDASKDK